MVVLFRVDASLEIGTGHVMRCLTLAEALLKKGIKSEFICVIHKGNLIKTIESRGFNVYQLSINQDWIPLESQNNYEKWLSSDWETDAQRTVEIASKIFSLEWIIVDHYAIDERWEKKLRSSCSRIMVIDDLANRPHECDFLLDQNFDRKLEDYAGLVSGNCKVLVGSEFALLRPEFAILRHYSEGQRKINTSKRLLITLGGIDIKNLTYQILEALKLSQLPITFNISVVMGSNAPSIQRVKKLASTMRWNTEVLVEEKKIGKLMAESNLAIGAAGTTAWERCCLGLPSIIVVSAENQRRSAEALTNAGAALLLESESLTNDLPKLIDLILLGDKLKQMRQVNLLITDGNGTNKVVEILTLSHECQ
jgi:UDP-2,4-diacetamido-2,4,6-trideoxy-beta-L-altropyranose hydrolase